MNFDHLQGQVDDTVDGDGEKDNEKDNKKDNEKDNENNNVDENILNKPQNDDESFKLDKNDFKFKYGFILRTMKITLEQPT